MFSAATALVTQLLDAIQQRDLDRFLSLLDSEVEIVPIVGSELAGTVYRGHEGVRDWWENYFARFGSVDVSLDEVRDLGAQVLAASRFHNPEPSDAQPDLVVWTVVALRDNRVLSWHSFRNEPEALESVGAQL